MPNQPLTDAQESSAQAVLRDVTAPSAWHTLTRPSRGTMTNMAAPAVSAQTHEERLAAAERAAYEQGCAHGRQGVLEQERARQRQAGYAEGMQAGLEQGRQSGEQTVRQAAAERLRQIEHVLQALPAQLDALLAAAEDDMLALSMEALHRFLGEHATQTNVIQAMLSVAIRDYRTRRKITVHLHPQDYQLVKDDQDFCTWLSHQEASAQLTLAANQEVRLGGVMLNSSEGTLDARLESQLQLLHGALLRQRTRAALKQPSVTVDAVELPLTLSQT